MRTLERSSLAFPRRSVGTREIMPEQVNKSPYKEGWMFKVKVKGSSELDELMDSEEYEKFVGEQK